MGDPLEVKVRGYQLSLRREEAAAVEVSQEVATGAGVDGAALK
jgi:Fe2+ transport system protein FeoA